MLAWNSVDWRLANCEDSELAGKDHSWAPLRHAFMLRRNEGDVSKLSKHRVLVSGILSPLMVLFFYALVCFVRDLSHRANS